MCAGGGAGRNGGSAEAAAFQGHVAFDGRIAAAVQISRAVRSMIEGMAAPAYLLKGAANISGVPGEG